MVGACGQVTWRAHKRQGCSPPAVEAERSGHGEDADTERLHVYLLGHGSRPAAAPKPRLRPPAARHRLQLLKVAVNAGVPSLAALQPLTVASPEARARTSPPTWAHKRECTAHTRHSARTHTIRLSQRHAHTHTLSTQKHTRRVSNRGGSQVPSARSAARGTPGTRGFAARTCSAPGPRAWRPRGAGWRTAVRARAALAPAPSCSRRHRAGRDSTRCTAQQRAR